MRSRMSGVVLVAAALTLLGAGAVAAQTMPRLPADIVLPQSGDSPGKVTFSHASHLTYQAKPDCTVCHPRLAPILGPAKGARRAPLTHASMLKGRACGACHGKDAHGFDDCATCHK